MAKRAPELTRVYVSESRRVKAQFSDNSLIVLDQGGGAFVHCCPQGSRVRQLTQFAVSRFEAKIASVLHFANMHLPEPFYCEWLVRKHSHECVFASGYAIRSVRWPESLEAGVREGIVDCLEDGGAMVRSEDGWAQVVIHPSRQRFAVCYPLLLSTEPKDTLWYIWHTQVFSVSNYPPRWAWAVALALHALEDDTAPESRKRREMGDNPHGERLQCVGEPSYDVEAATVLGGGSLTRTSELPVNAQPQPCPTHGSQISDDSWWFEATTTILPKTEAIVMEWSPEALYQYVKDEREVEAWVHSDESCVVTCKGGRFFRHVREPLAEDRMHTASSISQMLRSSEGGSAQATAKIAKRALKLRELALRNLEAVSSSGARPTPDGHPISNEVLEEQDIAGHGKFTAYADGRVRIRFADRTMLSMDAAHENCALVLPTGKRMEVRVDVPIGVRPYVTSALEFADWAFKTPAERGETLKVRMEIEAGAERCAMAAKICDWAIHRKVPKECAEALRGGGNANGDGATVADAGDDEVGGEVSDSRASLGMALGELDSSLGDIAGKWYEEGKREDLVGAWLSKTSAILDKMSL